MTEPRTPRWADIEAVAGHLAVSEATVRRLIARGKIRRYPVGDGRAVRYDLNQVDDMLTAAENAHPVTPVLASIARAAGHIPPAHDPDARAHRPGESDMYVGPTSETGPNYPPPPAREFCGANVDRGKCGLGIYFVPEGGDKISGWYHVDPAIRHHAVPAKWLR